MIYGVDRLQDGRRRRVGRCSRTSVLAMVAVLIRTTTTSAFSPTTTSRPSSSSSSSRSCATRRAIDPCTLGLASTRRDDEDELVVEDDARRRFLTVLAVAPLFSVELAHAAANDDDGAWRDGAWRDGASSPIDASSAATGSSVSTASSEASLDSVWRAARRRAVGGGRAGASAAVVQVCSLMWLRTAMNHQYKYGGDLSSSLETLWAEGGLGRLYRGLPFALVQGPLTRFGDTAANVGVLALLDASEATRDLPLPLKTLAGSVAAGAWRILCMPIDTTKTVLQVEGDEGLERLKERVLSTSSFLLPLNPAPLYRGALASAAATAAGHFPWYLTYNYLNDVLPVASKEDDLLLFLVRSAGVGLTASCVSDCVSNGLRVIKTTRQTSLEDDLTYRDALTEILERDGVAGLLGRGLRTRLLTNMIQGAVFSVLWKYFQTTSSS